MSSNKPKSNDSPITESYLSDVVILSTWLHGQESSTSKPIHRNRSHSGLSILTHLSTILTIGNQSAPKAHNVHAVIGILDKSEIQCLVFTENAVAKGKATPAGPGEGQLDELVVRCPDHGKQLLDNWDDVK
jgi:hypothetical protein